MRWEDARRSDNIEDRRGDDYADAGGGGGPMMGGAGHLGLGTMVILGVIAYALGIDPRILIGGAEMFNNFRGGGQIAEQQQAQPQPQARHTGAPSDQIGQFVAAIVGMNEDVWSQILPQQKGIKFTPAPLVLFNGATRSGCGSAQSAMGPFYCPNDKKVYLDTDFFDVMTQQLGSRGEFARAYVIAHEVGHHVQNLTGILPKFNRMRQQMSEADANHMSMQVELQADCFAGVWGHHAGKKSLLDPGDVEEGLKAAASIGDDVLQRRAQGHVSPESFTHGSAEQRVTWLRRGLTEGTIDACDTFGQASRR